MPRPRKIEKTRNSVSGTFLKTDFSKNEKFIENYLDCMSLNIFRSQGAGDRNFMAWTIFFNFQNAGR